jgi:cytoskeletal protein CcmA (bactofilin family)
LFPWNFEPGTINAWLFGWTSTHQGDAMLQKDSLFRRNDSFFRSTPPLPPATPAATAGTQPAAEAAKPAAEKAEERKESKLIVGPDIKMKGVEVTDCDTLVVEGRIEATLDSRVLQIAPNGTFCGTVAVDTAEVHGKLEGELTVRKQLVIHATGKVSGKIRYAKIKVEEGAELAGEISMMERGVQAQQGALIKRTGTL